MGHGTLWAMVLTPGLMGESHGLKPVGGGSVYTVNANLQVGPWHPLLRDAQQRCLNHFVQHSDAKVGILGHPQEGIIKCHRPSRRINAP